MTSPQVGHSTELSQIEVGHLRMVLEAIYKEANDGPDDSHLRLVRIMQMVQAERDRATARVQKDEPDA